MDHEDFPVPGFEFMEEAATDQQKDFIVEIARSLLGRVIDRRGAWPDPFTRWDAVRMIDAIEQEARERSSRGGDVA